MPRQHLPLPQTTLLAPTFFFLLLTASISCRKALNDKPTVTVINTSSIPKGYTMTPVGLMPSDHVHEIQPGFRIDYSNGHVLKVRAATNEIVEDFGEARPDSGINVRQFLRSHAIPKRSPSSAPSGGEFGSNWVTYTEWDNTTGETVSDFKSTWVVPAAPTGNNGSITELIYIWDGMTSNGPDGQPLLQPVLQWGYNNTWGGQYWSATNWAIFGTHAAYMTPKTMITPGTALTGEISWDGTQPDGSFNYLCGFSSLPAQTMNLKEGYQYPDHNGGTATVPTVPQLRSVFEVLEDPNYISQANQYPPQLSVNMIDISVQVGNQPGSLTPAPLNWEGFNPPGATLGEHYEVVSNNSNGQGQVDLFFQPCASPIPGPIGAPSWNESTLTLSWGAAANATQYEMVINGPQDGGAFYYTSATSIPNFFNTIEANNVQSTYNVTITPLGPCGNGPITNFSFNNCTNTLSAPTGVNWNNSTLTLSWNPVVGATKYEMIIQSGPDGGAFYNTTSTSIPNFFSTIEANNVPGNYTVQIIPQYACGNGPATNYSFTH